MNILLKIDPSSTTPIFQQIVDEFERLIITSSLKEGDALPSVRDFAVYHTINPNTVSRAYQLLQVMKLIEPVRGLGLRVIKINPKILQQRRSELLNTEINRIISVAKNLHSTPSELIRLIQAQWKG